MKRLEFYKQYFFVESKDEDLAVQLINIEQFVCNELQIPLNYYVQTTVLKSLAGTNNLK